VQVNEDQTLVAELVHDGERIKENSRAYVQVRNGCTRSKIARGLYIHL
jgi:hypothetical protein